MRSIRKLLPWCLKRWIWIRFNDLHCYIETRRLERLEVGDNRPTIYYLGITEHGNLGDLAQHLCIREWLEANYPRHRVVSFGSTPVVNARFDFVEKLRKTIHSKDIIVFQSGYTTQDLGGDHELMHRLVIEAMPDAPILMMPQTVFFMHVENRKRTSESYNRAHRMLFLARDRVSYQAACEMFPDVAVRLFPDIVTTRIGHHQFEYPRERILLCCRNDSEKFYTDEEIARLRRRVGELMLTDLSDTNSPVPLREIKKNLGWHIEREIEKFSHYRLTITDRYHGTIFSLAANTPVIILNTTDHKVTTGAEWFKGVYDGYVHVADSLDHAFDLAREIIANVPIRRLQPHFDTEYYGKLKNLFEETVV